jgi:hypothetical protein
VSGLGEIPDFILGQPLLEARNNSMVWSVDSATWSNVPTVCLPKLQAYYTVFDKEQQKIGFAPFKGC